MRIPGILRKLLFTLTILTLVVAVIAAVLTYQLFGSRAKLDGELTLIGPTDAIEILRDQQGVVTIEAQNRLDSAFALGFVHAQERFFQMDLLRRNSAGELSELFGDVALAHDQSIRVHQFRKRAEIAVNQLSMEQRLVLQIYAQGVNAGLENLRVKPFEYLLIQTEPQPWQAADVFLTVYSMYMDLQNEFGEGERSLTAMSELLPSDWFEFLTPAGGYWDAPLYGDNYTFDTPIPETPISSFQSETQLSHWQYSDVIERGSNGWAVGGALTSSGKGIVANDMHLSLSVPNIWFRARWPAADGNHYLTGVTLPGAPVLVAGSNGQVAWGFTNSYGDYLDVIRLQTDAEQTQYLAENGWKPFTTEQEIIRVKDDQATMLEVKLTEWGPVIGEDHFGNLLALRWVAHEPDGVNLKLLDLEAAANVSEALAIAPQTGVPGQNFVVADEQGNIGWTILGILPDRVGYSSVAEQNLLQRWHTGDQSWRGKLPVDQYPRINNPPSHRIWTGNARITDQADQKVVGDGQHALGARQLQIRDRLFDADQLNEPTHLVIQLDDEARFLARWQQIMVEFLSTAELGNDEVQQRLSTALTSWTGKAEVNSEAYLLVKRFRERMIDSTIGHIMRYVADKSGGNFWPDHIDGRLEYPVWALITQQPEMHVPAPHTDWSAFFADALLQLDQEHYLPEEQRYQRWGEANTLNIQHPISLAVPQLGFWLNMPKQPMPGDTYMPRVQSPDFGASERFVVAAGAEQNGYYHMATGQSGHPLSPFFRAGHRDWVEGNPSPFLPEETEHRLLIKVQDDL